jgi:hypothetical protein
MHETKLQQGRESATGDAADDKANCNEARPQLDVQVRPARTSIHHQDHPAAANLGSLDPE